MHIIHTLDNLNSFSGVTENLVNLIKYKGQRNIKYSIISWQQKNNIPRNTLPKNVNLIILQKNFFFLINFFIYINALMRVIKIYKNETIPDVIIHNHGLWSISNVSSFLVSRILNIPYLISIHGMLSPWALNFKSTKKKMAWHMYQKKILLSSSAIHATSKEEYRNISDLLPSASSKTFCVPLGVTIPRKIISCRNKKVLFLARIHQVKGIELLLNAWAISKINDWDLLIAGPGDQSYINSLKKLSKSLRINTKVTFLGPILLTHKQLFFSRGSIFILPSYSENFGLTIAEALASGLPVITTNRTPWASLEDKSAGWIISPDVNLLAETLIKSTKLELSELRVMGENGRKWMQENFLWSNCAIKISDIYIKILSKKGS